MTSTLHRNSGTPQPPDLWSNLSIVSKGLVLFAVPVCFELVFVFSFWYLLQESDRLGAMEAHRRAIATELQSLNTAVYTDLSLLMAYHASHSPLVLKRVELQESQIKERIDLVQSLAELEGLAPSQTIALKNSLNQLAKGLSEAKHLILNEQELGLGSDELLKHLQPSIASFIHDSDQIVVGMLKAPTSSLSYQSSRDLLRQVLIIGLAVNAVVALLLPFGYTKSISQRLQRVLGDIRCLLSSERQLQGEPLAGNDEFGAIDRALYTIDGELRSQNEERAEIVAMVGHDLRSPLVSTDLKLGLLTRGSFGELSPDVSRELVDTKHSLWAMLRMIDDLLDAEQMRVGKLSLSLESVPFDEVVGSAVKQLEPLAAGDGVKLITECESVFVVCDPLRVRQVVLNLVSNAIKFSSEGKSILVRVHSDESDVVLEVADQGAGISEENLPRVFDRYYQSKFGERQQSGSVGLGLHICKRITEMHGGAVSVTSETKTGTVFTVRFPKSGPVSKDS